MVSSGDSFVEGGEETQNCIDCCRFGSTTVINAIEEYKFCEKKDRISIHSTSNPVIPTDRHGEKERSKARKSFAQ
jgi:hypothetical protein